MCFSADMSNTGNESECSLLCDLISDKQYDRNSRRGSLATISKKLKVKLNQFFIQVLLKKLVSTTLWLNTKWRLRSTRNIITYYETSKHFFVLMVTQLITCV